VLIIALLCLRVASAFGGEVALSGTFVVCKRYGTQLGVFLTNARGRDIRRLNHLFGEDVCPRLSPDGERVLLNCRRDDVPGVWMMNRTGGEQKRICDGDQGCWSPDGHRIACRRQGRIVERWLDSEKETVLSPSGWTQCSWPVYSPDGKRLLFVAPTGGRDGIFVMTPGGNDREILVEGEILSAPRWRPGGEKIAYQDGSHIWIMAADGSGTYQLTTAGGIQRAPAWSPDGSTVAYSQGPDPKGPWQIHATSIDGRRTVAISKTNARSVLSSDWGAQKSGEEAAPWRAKPTFLRPEPGIRVWDTCCRLGAFPTDWSAFYREKAGWRSLPSTQACPKELRGGCVVENEKGCFFLSAGKAGAFLMCGNTAPGAIELVPIDSQGHEVKQVESIRVVRHDRSHVALESTSRSGGRPAVRIVWRMTTGPALIRVAPVEKAAKLGIRGRMRSIVVPDRSANDLVLDARDFRERSALLPHAAITVGLLESSPQMLVLIRPKQDQRTELHRGESTGSFAADVLLQDACVSVGLLDCERGWHVEHFREDARSGRRNFNWRMPFAATWRLTVQGDGKRYSTLFGEKESPYFDKKTVFFRRTKDFDADVQLGVIYLYDRAASTPLDTLTPVDLLRETLGVRLSREALDVEGLTGYGTASRWTTWADLPGTIRSLRYLFDRRLEVAQKVYVGHLCDDILPFVEGLDQRLDSYRAFTKEVETLCGELRRDASAPPRVVEDVMALTNALGRVGDRRRDLKEPKTVLPHCTKIKQLTAQDSPQNKEKLDQISKDLVRVVGPREEVLREYRKAATQLRDAAGTACLRHPELIDFTENIRALCQRALRNRLYAEAGWRGERYERPLFWLGPRPYQ